MSDADVRAVEPKARGGPEPVRERHPARCKIRVERDGEATEFQN
jgi:hypothetical protein